MRTLTFLLATAAAGSLLYADGNSASATAQASTRIVAPVKVVANSDLKFGNIVVDDLGQAAEVTMTTAIAAGQLVCTPTLGGWTKCAPYKHQGDISGATFHYSYDVWGAAHNGVKVTVPATLSLTGGFGGACTVNTNNDMPADDCFLSVPGLDPNIPGYVSKKHFGVGGKLLIPAGALGEKKGTLTVTVEYI